ncbi:hypothetical protein AD929_01970 [Gluconobacter potus]|uniref:Lipoprotein n=2 Tax=Gluconobacter potus TaxID=2724927 RepID=A0A149QZG4_9PROT|nr:hypothetical protein AD929_01970 [Gluconobacter potus]
MTLKGTSKALLSSSVFLLLAACGGGMPAPEPVLLSQFNQNTDRFGVVSTVGKPEGTIQKSGRPCDIYKIYTSGLTAGGRAAMKAGEVVTSVATLGLAQIVWAPVKAGTRPQQHTVLFCFGPDDKLVDIYDKDPTDSDGPDHLILNRTAYSRPVVVQPAVPVSPVEVAAQPEQAAVVTPPEAPAAIEAVAPAPGAPTKTADGAPIIYEKPVAPKAAADAGAITLDNMAQEATTGRAQVQTGAAKVGADASADDLNSISSDKAAAANKAALSKQGS